MNGYFIFLNKKKRSRNIAVTLLLSILFQLGAPLHTFALTSGPSQEEYASFEPFETNQMVDPYSGDFNYNLPLLSIPGPNGGYPINMSYHSGITMDQEASWVGLGWNLNVGAINRGLRGLPDDIKGLDIKQTVHIKDHYTTSLSLPYVKKKEYFGVEGSSGTIATQIYYNNYKGVGYRVSYNANFRQFSNIANAGFGLSFDSQNGIGISPQISASNSFGEAGGSIGLSADYNSRNGLTHYGVSGSVGLTDKDDVTGLKYDNEGVARRQYQSYSPGSSLSFPTQFYAPQASLPMEGKRVNFDYKFPISFLGGSVNAFPVYSTKTTQFMWYQGMYEESKIANDGVITHPGFGYLYASNASSAQNDFERKEIAYSKKVPNIAPSAFTYDVFSVSGQGVGGMFRPYRNDVGVLFDPEVRDEKNIQFKNIEAGIDQHVPTPPVTVDLGFHAGFNIKINGSDVTTKGKWSSGLGIPEKFTYLANNPLPVNVNEKALYEPSYFQMYGEKTALYDDENMLRTAGGGWADDYPVRAKLYKQGNTDFEVDAGTNFVYYNNGAENTITAPKNVLTPRKRRANNIEYITTTDAKKYGVSASYTYSVQNSPTPVSKFSNLSGDLNEQLSEVVVRQADGARYVYGLPAYNYSHTDANFRVNFSSNAHQPILPADICNTTGCNSPEKAKYVSTDFGSSSGPKTGGIPHAVQTNNGDVLDEFVSKVDKPVYAHAWMLTHLLGSDYVDCDGVYGPSDGDYGYWVKFNYKKTASNYKWRFPFHDAGYSANSISNPKDDMGNYSYGTKDVFYLESIETKTHKVIYYTSERKDGYEAKGEFNTCVSGGGIDYTNTRGTNKLFKLDSLSLYTKAALASAIPADKVALQTVHFQYNYSLCKGVPNNEDMAACGSVSANSGKLTLTNVYFTFNGSQRGKLSKYTFNYGQYKDASGNPAVSNPNYDPYKVDRWGYYNAYEYGVPTTGGGGFPTITPTNIEASNPDLPLTNLPYTSQTLPPDPYAWNLTTIETPTGGKIKVEYEPDDYCYVQDKPAMQMFNIRSVWQSSLFGSANIANSGICSGLSCSGNTSIELGVDPDINTNSATFCNAPAGSNSSVIFFDLEKPVMSNNVAAFAAQYLKGITASDKIYFKACMAVNKSSQSTRAFENISGYASIDMTSGNYGYAKSSPSLTYYDLGFIALKNEKISKVSGKYLHPFQQAAINYVRMNRPEYIYQSANTWSNSGFAVANVGSLFSFITDIAKNIQSFNKFAAKKGIGDRIKLSGHSMIRLGAPDDKYGGGIRVKRIYIEDNFKTSTANIYGQEYDYKIEENGVMVSSGVAYEPQVGGDESALRKCINYTESSPLKSPVTLFLEEPILEQFYPGSSVGYRKVTVKSIARSQAEAALLGNSDRESICEAQPATIYEYYTPKDFPIYYEQTNLTADAPIKKAFPAIPGLPGSMKHILARSQGYTVVINDMAGKLKSVTSIVPAKNLQGNLVYAQGRVLHKETYNYRTAAPYNAGGSNKLDNNVVVLDENGCFKNARIGETCDIYLDANEDKNEVEEDYINTNIGISLRYTPPAALVIIPMPVPIPKFNQSLVKYKSIVTMKIINRTGVLMSTEVYDGQAYNKKENLVFSSANGEPIYTKTQNEFKDDIYNFSYPGYVHYKYMGGSYQNQHAFVNLAGWSITSATNSNKEISFSVNNVADLFSVGDKLWVDDAYFCHVLDKGLNGTTKYIRCIDANGNFIAAAPSKTIKVIEPGIKNMQSVQVGNVTTLKTAPYPITPGSSCANGSYGFWIDPVPLPCPNFSTTTIPNVLNVSAVAYTDDWATIGTIANMTQNQPYTSGTTGSAVNPFYKGIKGIWRPVAQYAFMAKRKQDNYNKTDGTFDLVPFIWNNKDFATYMNDPAITFPNGITCSKKLPAWNFTNVVTKVSPYGYELENMGADSNFNAAQYGYKHQLVKATAANSEYTEMLYDGFEDYQNGYGYSSLNENHWQFNSVSSISSQFAHTGRYSLKMPAGASTPLEVKVPVNRDYNSRYNRGFFSEQLNYAIASTGAVTTNKSYNDIFSPRINSAYEVSFWVRENKTGSATYFTDKSYKNPNVLLEFYNSTGVLINSAIVADPLRQAGARIIEGWQRVVASVNVPATAYTMKVKFVNQNINSGADVYFDDIRFYPANGYLKSFVYDPVTLRTTATLDENNYATFYVYDNEGKLVITRKETKDGIKTISEGRTGSKQ